MYHLQDNLMNVPPSFWVNLEMALRFGERRYVVIALSGLP